MPKLEPEEQNQSIYWHVIKWKKFRYGTGMPLMKDDMRFRCFDKEIALQIYRNAIDELIAETVQGWRSDIDQCGVVFAYVELSGDAKLTRVMSFSIGGDKDVQIPDCESRNSDDEGQDHEERPSKTWKYPSRG